MLNNIIDTLEDLIENGPNEEYKRTGLCAYLVFSCKCPSYHLDGWLKEQFKEWPEFSGDIVYPVPSIFGPCNAYNLSYKMNRMYKGFYGRKRIRLAKFLLEQARKELELSC